MNIIPKPKYLEIQQGFLKNRKLKLNSGIDDKRILNALKWFEMDEEGIPLKISIGNDESEAYNINIKPDCVEIKSEGVAGAFYAIQTLKQIFSHNEIPCCYIQDTSDFKYRGFYHDITRGRIPTVQRIKKLIDDMAYYKLNSLQLYVEHTFEFREFADSIEKTGYLSAEEIREIDEYCKMNFIEFIPSLSTFGHLFELLEKDEYKHLHEIEEFESRIFWEDRMAHHTIDPTKGESFQLIKSLIDQYIVNFSSDEFNICCDETFDLKIGRHKSEDTAELYLDFVKKLIAYLKSKDKSVMMWADIILNSSERINDLPKDVTLLNWFYWDNPDENTFKIIHDAGYRQIVCPGTVSWSRFCEDYKLNIKNITKMIELGYKYDAAGVLNTNWGDWGNPCSIELAMFGLVLGAAKSWNVTTNVDEDYLMAVNKLLYKKERANEYIKRISELCNTISWLTVAKHYANVVKGKVVFDDFKNPSENDIHVAINECFEIINEVNSEEWQEEKFKEQIIITAQGIAVMAEILAKSAGYSINRKTDTKKWLEDYRRLWLIDNKESELYEIEKVFYVLDRINTCEAE